MTRAMMPGALLLIFIGSGCERSDDNLPPNALLVVSAANDVSTKKIGPWWQTYCTVNTPFPADDVLGQIREHLSQKGWHPLEEGFTNPALPASHVHVWRRFMDATTPVHQWRGKWENANGDVVSYALQYRYETGAPPDLNTLRVSALFEPREVVGMKPIQQSDLYKIRGLRQSNR